MLSIVNSGAQHFGQVVLALLAYDRFSAVKNPLAYMAENPENKTRMWKRLGLALVVVIGAVSLPEFGKIFVLYRVLTSHTKDVMTALAYLTQSIYLLASLIM